MVGYTPRSPPQTKVKTFYSDNYDEIDKEVNEFIKDKNIIDIKFYAFKGNDDDEFYHYRMVMYRD